MEIRRFTLRDEHLKLMKAFSVDWEDCEFGAPCIDPKRPYGNSDVYQDMLEILGIETVKDGIYNFKLFGREYLLKGEDEYNIDLDNEDKLLEQLKNLHQDTVIALQICLTTQSFEAGIYEADEYKDDWHKIS